MGGLPSEFWIVVSQFDTNVNGVVFRGDNLPKGPLVHEAYMLTEEAAHERATTLSRSGYGWISIMKVIPAQSLHQFAPVTPPATDPNEVPF